jgi:hypothetical protein
MPTPNKTNSINPTKLNLCVTIALDEEKKVRTLFTNKPIIKNKIATSPEA